MVVLDGKDRSRILCSSCQLDARYEIMSLPCSNVICLNRFDAMFENDLQCRACGARHEPAEFAGSKVDLFKESLANLQKSQLEFNASVKNVQITVRDYCEKLRTEVNAQTQLVVENVNQINRRLIKQIDEYEDGLLGQFKSRDPSTFNLRENWNRLLAQVGQFNLKWLSYLEQTEIDEKEIERALTKANQLKKVIEAEHSNIEHVTFGKEILVFEVNELLPKNHNPLGELNFIELDDEDDEESAAEKETNVSTNGKQTTSDLWPQCP